MITLIATAAFGLEAVVKREIENLGYKNITGQDGRVEFTIPENEAPQAIARSNLWLRSADRVLVKIGEFKTTTFNDLFEETKALPWDDWIPSDAKFTVTGKSVRSALFSVPDVQSIVKKAVVEKLKQKYKLQWFQETGAEYTIQAALLKDIVTLTIDTTGTGQGLHKRGYREKANKAPLKETLAAALIELSRYPIKHGRLPLLDPCCGSGTIPIEAAMQAKNIAPGLARTFASESWEQVPKAIWKETRANAYAAMRTETEPQIYASDIDPTAIELAKTNAELAGVDDCIIFENKPLSQITLPTEAGISIINPPYGERLGQIKEAEALYAELGRLFNPTKWNVYILTPDEFFETAYKKKARAKRKLFNGMIKTDLFQYF